MMSHVVETPPLRKFGLMVGGILAVIGLWPLLVRGNEPRLWALVVAGALMIPAVVAPGRLRLVYRGWMALGGALGWINTNVILAVLFYGLCTPLGLARRLFSKDPMRLRFQPNTATYRATRQPRPCSHMSRQY